MNEEINEEIIKLLKEQVNILTSQLESQTEYSDKLEKIIEQLKIISRQPVIYPIPYPVYTPQQPINPYNPWNIITC